MNTFSDYERQKKADLLAWHWFPRSLGFWAWLVSTLYLWKEQAVTLDNAATNGFVVGIIAVIIAKLLTQMVGPIMVQINLWEYGCGCLVRAISTELFHYLAIAIICVLAWKAEELSITFAIIAFVTLSLNWLLATIKDI